MELFVHLAAKSLLIAGGALLLLRLMQKRSAADRSLVAHLGLAAVLALPIIAFAFPPLEVAGPAFLTKPAIEAPAMLAPTAAPEVATGGATFQGSVEPVAASAAIDWAFWAYAAPACLLVLLTLIALLRLIPLKARAHVLVEPHWLSALAHAQRRMGFKNGTALLTSDDIRSPISWGLMRPVILLNRDATEAHAEAEAIIAHELAHVAGLDWAKLLLARITVALFWFNPLVWLLAREAHQLREEAADDAVLASNIEDTDYANLLVGIAKHECRGLLLGAHGVAPARNSLARRVRRVLDSASERAPGGWRWSAAAAFFAAGMAVPVAALQVIEPTIAEAQSEGRIGSTAARPAADSAMARASEATEAATAADATAATAAAVAEEAVRAVEPRVEAIIDKRALAARFAVAEAALAKAEAAFAKARPQTATDAVVDAAISAKIHGITPEYARAMRSAAPALARADMDELVGLKIHGVTPAYVRELQSATGGTLTVDDIQTAAIHKVSGAYLRGMAAAGYGRRPIEDLVEMKIMGVTPEYAARLRRAGYRNLTAEQIVQMRNFGVDPADLQRAGDGDP